MHLNACASVFVDMEWRPMYDQRKMNSASGTDSLLLFVLAATPAVFLYAAVKYSSLIKRRGGKATPLNALVGSFLVLLFMSSLSLLGAEIYFRYFFNGTDSFLASRVSQEWFQRNWAYNQQGYRDDVEYEFRKPPGKTRVTFVGDSFTAGHGVTLDKRFVSLLRAKEPEVEIQSLARCGYDTPDEISDLKRMMMGGYETDLVILVYTLNDIIPVTETWSVISELQKIAGAPHGYLVDHSYFINFFYYHLILNRHPGFKGYFSFVKDSYEDPAWTTQKENLAEIENISRAGGAKFAVVIFPFLNAIGENYEFRPIHEKLDKYFQDRGVATMDLLPVYMKYSSKELVVSRYDAHPNAKAHAIAADEIDRFVKGVLSKQ